jgi:NAD(P)-dependent dehydrogenase (short-subunit alcohol dehydrogenase family)
VSATSGLGAALCRRFAEEGYHILVAGRTPEKVAQVLDDRMRLNNWSIAAA